MVEKGAKSANHKEMLLCLFKSKNDIVSKRFRSLFYLYTHLFFFRDMLNSLVTVFILFTMDHWYALLQDTWKVPEVSHTFSSIYVILCLLLGSIIFRNIIVAMMGKHRRGETWWEAGLGTNQNES